MASYCHFLLNFSAGGRISRIGTRGASLTVPELVFLVRSSSQTLHHNFDQFRFITHFIRVAFRWCTHVFQRHSLSLHFFQPLFHVKTLKTWRATSTFWETLFVSPLFSSDIVPTPPQNAWWDASSTPLTSPFREIPPRVLLTLSRLPQHSRESCHTAF